MKKVLCFILLICIGIFIYFMYIEKKDDIYNLLDNIEDEFNVEKYSVFGTHFLIEGCYDKKINGDLSLVLKNSKEEIKLKSEFYYKNNNTCFIVSKYNNDGIYLDELKKGKYLLLISSNDKYYTLNNQTDYGNLEYYTITKDNKNNKINISFDKIKKHNYVEFKIESSSLPEDVYDITLDPGHGGKDPGAVATLNGKDYNESDLTLKIALLLKKDLEKDGLKVKITRDTDINMPLYGDNGRAVIPNSYHTKYSISIHLNSNSSKMNYGGVEVYVPNDINYEFAEILASNLSKEVEYSKKVSDRVSKGIYFSYFTNSDISDLKLEMKEKGMKPYDIKIGTPYLGMIREVGGINTNAYVDGRNDYYGLNKFYSSNITAEPYLLELGYMNYKSDLEKIVLHPEKFSSAISKSIKKYLGFL